MIEVRGYIDDLLANEEYRDFLMSIEDSDEFFITMIDAPIVYNSKPIGVVNDIDFDDRTWSGVIWSDSAIEIDVCNDNTFNEIKGEYEARRFIKKGLGRRT